jgi:hypothetical protein
MSSVWLSSVTAAAAAEVAVKAQHARVQPADTSDTGSHTQCMYVAATAAAVEAAAVMVFGD